MGDLVEGKIKPGQKLRFFIFITLVALMITSGGIIYYTSEKRKTLETINNELSAIADLKTDQVLQWYEERLSELKYFSANPVFNKWLSLYVLQSDSSYLSLISNDISVFSSNQLYQNIFILFSGNEIIYSQDSTFKNISTTTSLGLKKLLENNLDYLVDFSQGSTSRQIRLDFMAPLINSELDGVIVFRMNPEIYLYPLLERWPIPCNTCETALIREEGDSIRVLNELRFGNESALNLTISKKRESLSPEQSKLGNTGLFEELDYRNKKVLSVIREIPGTGWYMVTKIDKNEVFIELYKEASLILLVILLLILLTSVIISRIFQKRQKGIHLKLSSTKKELQASQIQYHTTLKSIGDAVLTTDTKGVVQFLNPVAEDLTGWNSNEAVGKDINEVFYIVNEDSGEAVKNPVERVLEEEGIIGLANHTLLISKNGKKIPIADSGAPIKNEKGEISGVVMVFQDQTEKRKKERELIESEWRFRNVFENSMYGKSLTGLDGSLKVNKAFCEMLGYTKEELLKISWKQITHPEDIENSEKVVKDLLDKKIKSARFEKRYIHKNGNIIWTSVNTTLQFDQEGNALYFISSIIDITERKNNEKILEYNRELLHEMGEIAKVGAWEFDVVTGKGTWTEEVAKIHDLDPKDETNMELGVSFYVNDSRAKIEGAIKRAIEKAKPYNLELEMITAKGNRKYIQTIGKPVIQNGKVIKVRGSFQDITNRKKAINALRKSEERFRSTLDNMLEGCQIIDANWKYIYINDAAEAHNRRPNTELLGNKYMDMWPGIEKTEVFRHIEKCLNEKVPYHMENEFVFPDGSIGWFELSIQSVPEGVFILSYDITDRKKAEKNLSESHSRLIKAQQIAKMGDFTWNVSTGEVKWSEAMFDLLKYDKNDKIDYSRANAEIHHPDDVEMVTKWLDNAIQSGAKKLEPLEYRVFKKDKELIYIKTTGVIERTKNNEVVVFATILDITERKQREEEIKSLNEKLLVLINAIKDLANAQSVEEVQSIVSHSARNINNSDGATIVFQEDGNCFYADEDAISPLWKGKRFPMETCISGWVMINQKEVAIKDIYKDARIPHEAYRPTFVKSLLMVPIIGKEAIGAIGNYWDTEHEINEKETQLLQSLADSAYRALENIRLYSELEDRINIRTSQLEEANKELKSFAYTVSHDLRAPLRGINSFTEILMEDYGSKLDNEGKRICSVIQKNSKKMGQLIDDILTFSRLGRGGLSIDNVSMKEIIEEVADDVIQNDVKKKVKLNIHSVCDIRCDAKMIRQVWANLISNAVKFSSLKEHPVIDISCKSNKEEATFCIEDNGAGFDINYADKLFGIFQRLHNERDFPGTGVGLAIVHRIIKRHNGEIWADSEVGKGAKFYFTLPLVQENVIEDMEL